MITNPLQASDSEPDGLHDSLFKSAADVWFQSIHDIGNLHTRESCRKGKQIQSASTIVRHKILCRFVGITSKYNYCYYRKYMIIWFHMISEIYGFEKIFKIFFNCNVCNSTWRFLSIVVVLVFEAKQKKWITDSSKVEYTVNTLALQTIFPVSKSTDNDASSPRIYVRKQRSNGSYVYTQFFFIQPDKNVIQN